MSVECVKCGSTSHGSFPCRNCGCELPPVKTGLDWVVQQHEATIAAQAEEIERLQVAYAIMIESYKVCQENERLLTAENERLQESVNTWIKTAGENQRDRDHLVEQIEKWKAKAEALWILLDDIDTAGDMFKPAIGAYFRYVNGKASERFQYMESDGYKIINTQLIRSVPLVGTSEGLCADTQRDNG